MNLCRGRLQNFVQSILRVLSGLPAPAPTSHRSRDWIVGSPRSIGKLEKIVARIDLAVEIVNFNAVQGLGNAASWRRSECKHEANKDHGVRAQGLLPIREMEIRAERLAIVDYFEPQGRGG